MDKCGIPGCHTPKWEGYPICKEHVESGYLDDYYEYRALREEGVVFKEAAIRAGLMDPPEDD